MNDFDPTRALRNLRDECDFARQMACKLRKEEHEIANAKALALGGLRDAQTRGFEASPGLMNIEAAINNLVSSDTVSCANELTLCLCLAEELALLLESADGVGSPAYCTASPFIAEKILDILDAFGKARGIAQAAAKSNERAMSALRTVKAVLSAM